MAADSVRVRFAPSPTGPLHIGGVRTALYNYLYARKTGGKMILRMEDTDQTRYVPGAEEYIQEALEWCGIHVDESPQKGGDYNPYRQSERKEIYQQYVNKLLEEGSAYYAFDTEEELEEMRRRLKAARVQSPQYNAVTRTTMKNSLTLPEDEVQSRINNGDPYVVRLKVPKKEEVRLHDEVRGWVMVHSSSLDDKVLLKADGMPTYHMANVVDDYLMDITHVIRGEEWLPSAPLHALLYRYLGWGDSMPTFAHMPLILNPDGNGKLSKRDAEQRGFPVFPIEWKDPESGEVNMGFREEGYLPEAIVNFLAMLGWNPGTNEEMFTMDELTEAFSLERIGKSGTKFDIHKAHWFNQEYLRRKSDEELKRYLLDKIEAKGLSCSEEKAFRICELLKDRVVFPKDFYEEGEFFFYRPEEYDEQAVNKKWNVEAAEVIAEFREKLQSLEAFNADNVKELLMGIIKEKGLKPGKVMPALRIALTGKGAGPDLMTIVEILGKEEVTERIDKALNLLQNKETNV